MDQEEKNLDKRIREIFKEQLEEQVLHITDHSIGDWQIVKEVNTKNKKYIIKFADKIFIYREKFGCNNLSGIVPAPQEIASTDEYIIQTYFRGKNLNTVTIDEKTSRQVYFHLGQILFNIHNIKTSHFGPLTSEGRGQYPTLKKYVESWFDKGYQCLKRTGFLDKSQLLNLVAYLKEREEFLQTNESCLLHFDFEDWNVRVKDGKVTGVFDFNNIATGPKAYDLARPYLSHLIDGNFDHIFRGHGSLNLEQIQFYAIIETIRLLPTYIKKSYTKKLDARLNIVKNVISH